MPPALGEDGAQITSQASYWVCRDAAVEDNLAAVGSHNLHGVHRWRDNPATLHAKAEINLQFVHHVLDRLIRGKDFDDHDIARATEPPLLV